MRGQQLVNVLLIVAVVAIGLGVVQYFGGPSNLIKCLPAECVCWNQTSSVEAQRYDDGVDVGVGAVAINPFDTPVSAYRMQSGARAGKLQAVIFTAPEDCCSNIRATAEGLNLSGWTIGSDGMIAFADARAQKYLLARATGGESVRLPYVVVFRDGVALRRFDASGITTADQLGNMLNRLARDLKVGFR